MSYTVLAVWSHLVLSFCYTEHGQRCGAIMSGRITILAMYRSGQLVLRCIVEPTVAACLHTLQAPQ
jgi:hypothetical protein